MAHKHHIPPFTPYHHILLEIYLVFNGTPHFPHNHIYRLFVGILVHPLRISDVSVETRQEHL
jgi:hypothetical protein